MDLLRRTGRIDFLRVHARGGYGPPDDHLSEDAIAGIDAEPGHRFGVYLRDDDKLPVHQAMVNLLRDGLIHDVETTVEYFVDTDAGRTNGETLRVELRRR